MVAIAYFLATTFPALRPEWREMDRGRRTSPSGELLLRGRGGKEQGEQHRRDGHDDHQDQDALEPVDVPR